MNDILDDDLISKDHEFDYRTWHFYVWIPLFIIGVLFKIMHWPGSSFLMLFPSAILVAHSVCCAMRFKGRNIHNNMLLAAGVLWTAYLIFGAFFNNANRFNFKGLMVYGIAFFLSFVFYEILFRFRLKKHLKHAKIENLFENENFDIR